MTEIKRIRDWREGDIACLGCGKLIHLFFNGGELDRQDCCGFIYKTEDVQVDLVILQK